MEVGDEVFLAVDIYEYPGDTPGGYCGYVGDKVVILEKHPYGKHPYIVRHPEVKEGGFSVSRNELMWRKPFEH